MDTQKLMDFFGGGWKDELKPTPEQWKAWQNHKSNKDLAIEQEERELEIGQDMEDMSFNKKDFLEEE